MHIFSMVSFIVKYSVSHFIVSPHYNIFHSLYNSTNLKNPYIIFIPRRNNFPTTDYRFVDLVVAYMCIDFLIARYILVACLLSTSLKYDFISCNDFID